MIMCQHVKIMTFRFFNPSFVILSVHTGLQWGKLCLAPGPGLGPGLTEQGYFQQRQTLGSGHYVEAAGSVPNPPASHTGPGSVDRAAAVQRRP